MKKKGMSGIIRIVLQLLLGFGAGLVLGLVLVNVSDRMAGPAGIVWALFCLALAFLFHLFLHEAGHLLFGLKTGYRFLSYRIFSWVFQKRDGKWEVKRFSLPGTGGQCLMEPPAYNEGNFDTIWYNLGGILVNLISGLLFLLLAFLFRSSPWALIFFLMFGLTGIITAAVNGIPLHMSSGLENDGYNVRHLKEDPEARRAFWISMEVNALQNRGMRLKEMPEEWFEIREISSPLSASLAVLAENRLMDQLDFEQAETLIKELLENEMIPDLYRNLLRIDQITIDLYNGNRFEARRALEEKPMQNFLKTMRNLPGCARISYLYAKYGKQDAKQEARTWKFFEDVRDLYPNPGEVATDSDIIRKFRLAPQSR